MILPDRQRPDSGCLSPQPHHISSGNAAERKLHLAGKLVIVERLADNAGIIDAGGPARSEKPAKMPENSGALTARGEHFGAVHARHGKIDDQQIDFRLAVENIKRGASASRFEHEITEIVQHRPCHFANIVVVIDEQDRCTTQRPAAPGRVGADCRSGSLCSARGR